MTIMKEGALASFYTVNKAPIKHLKVYFSPKQAGSGDTSPENIRPIEGQNKINFTHSNKSLIPFGTVGPFSYYFNGYNTTWIELKQAEQYIMDKNIYYTYSCYIDNTNGTKNSSAQVWFKNIDNTQYLHVASGNSIAVGSAGWSKVTFKPNENDYYLGLGISLQSGATASHGMLEVGKERTEYEVSEREYKEIEFPSQTKNLFDPNCDMLNYPSTYTINSDGSITQKQSDGRGWLQNNFPPIHLAAGTYTITCSDGGAFNIALDSSNFSTTTRYGNGGGTFTLTNDNDIKLKHSASSYPTTFTIQLEKNSSATTYEPFYNTIYGGYIDLITGELVEEYAIASAKKSDFGNISTPSSGGMPYRQTSSIYLPTASGVSWSDARKQQLFNYGTIANPWSETNYGNYIGVIITQDNYDMHYMRISEEVYQAMGENDSAIISYKLATPIIHQLTSTELQTFIGQNNIWSNADRVEVEYDLAESNDELYRRRNIILQGAPHLETTTGDIVNFNTDLIAPIKDAKIYFNPVQEGEGDPSLENVRPINGWTGLDINQTGKNLINLSTVSKQNNSSNIDTTITDNTITITAKKANGSGVLLQQTIYWDIPPALRGKEVYFGVGSVNLTTNNENHRATIVCEFKDKDSKFIVDPTVVSWTNGSNSNTIARKYTIPQNAAKLELYFRIAQNASTYGIIVGDSVTYNNFYIRRPTNTYGYEEYNGNIIPITFPTVGKNLLDITRTEKINPGASTSNITISNGVISIDAVASSARSYVLFSQEFSAGTYTIQVQKSGAVGTPRLLTTSEISNSSYNTYYTLYSRQMASDSLTFTLTQTSKIGLVLSNLTNESGNPGTIYDIQLESGSTATSYEPYTNTVYSGYLDLINGKLIKEWEKTSLKNKGWYNYSGFQWFAFNLNKDPNTDVYCNCFTVYDATNPSASRPNECITSYHNGASYADKLFFWKTDGNLSSDEDFKDWMNSLEYDPYIIYKLKTPIEYPLTSQTLKAFKGTNNIWSNANGPVSITYWTH